MQIGLLVCVGQTKLCETTSDCVYVNNLQKFQEALEYFISQKHKDVKQKEIYIGIFIPF